MSETIKSSSEAQEDLQSNTTPWDSLAEVEFAGGNNISEPAETPKLTEKEQAEVESFQRWYTQKKAENPNISEEDFRITITSGLGYNLDYPENPDDYSEEQKAKIEELYQAVVNSPKNRNTEV